MNNEKYLSNQEWKNLLTQDFASLVKEKTYKKLDYQIWRKLITTYEIVSLTYHKEDATIQAHLDGSNFEYFDIDDESLGQFLFDEYFKEEEKMLIKDETYKINSDSTLNSISSNYNKAYATEMNAIQASKISVGTIELDDSWTSISAKADKVDLDYMRKEVESLKTDLDILREKTEEKKEEKKNMKNFNFDFGPCTGNDVRMSMYGVAVKNAAGTWVSYNPASKEIIDVDIFNFDGAKYLYKMPVSLKDVAVGDVIIHNRKPMFVEGFSTLGDIMAVDPVAGERKEVLLTRSPFGFNFVTKVVSVFGAIAENAPTPDAPFGNMLPFLMMGEGEEIDPMMLMMMMGGKMDMSNPMMMYFLMKDNKDNTLLPLMMIMNNK
jgi:hypothetical protein